MRRAVKRAGSGGGGQLAPAPEWVAKAVPCLWEFLTDGKWDDGATRQLGTVLLFLDGFVWKCWVNDKAQGRTAFVSGESLLDCLMAVEEGLREDWLDWRQSNHQQRGGKRS